jgi:precorrin-6Y C5,15-methyltransferase (decarboxylating)
MKQVAIVGTGMGPNTLTAQALRAIEQADALIGAPRLIAQFEKLGKPSFAQYAPQAVAGIVNGHEYERLCVLVSGDTGFFSAANGLRIALKDHIVEWVPGISSLSYFFSKIMRPWQDAKVISCHGKSANIVDTVRRNRITFTLTGGNSAALAEELTDYGFGELAASIGENLGFPDEQIRTMPISQVSAAKIDGLAVLMVENPGYDKRSLSGIPDEKFVRGSVPMTKAETRAVTISKLALPPNAVCCDIGAGTGAVTVEMALAAYEGHIYAVDKNEEAIRLVQANCRAFHIGNVKTVLGQAPEALKEMPPLDAAFIGGSAGSLTEIFDALLLNNQSVRIVVNAVALETVHQAMQAFAKRNIEPDVVQISAARANPVGNLHMLQANSPVFILSGGGDG